MRKELLLFVLIFLLPGCTAPVKPRIIHKECEQNIGESWNEQVKILNKGFYLEDIGDVALRDDEYIVRFYEDFSLNGETVIQAIMKNGTMSMEIRAPVTPIKSDVMDQIRSASAGKGLMGYITAEEYTPTSTLEIYRRQDEEHVSHIRRFIEKWDLLQLKNIFHCYDNGEEILQLDGITYIMEIRKGNRRHLVIFRGREYKYEPYMELMALFEKSRTVRKW